MAPGSAAASPRSFCDERFSQHELGCVGPPTPRSRPLMNRRLVLAGALGMLAGGGALAAYGASRTSAKMGGPSAPKPAPEKPSPTPPAFSLARVDAANLVSVTT